MAGAAPTLAFLRELEQADGAVAAVLEELDGLAVETERVRSRAVELEAFLTVMPAERTRLAQAAAAAEEDAVGAAETFGRAERELAEAEGGRDEERLAAARRLVVRARDRLTVAERRRHDAESEREGLERRAADAEREADELAGRARELAESLRDRPRLAEDAGREPAPGLAGVSEWGGRAHAALFVARGALASEREAVIRQANELGSLVLGEPLTSASASAVARRVERTLGRQ